MLPTLNLFSQVPCPDHRPPASSCPRSPCLFSHTPSHAVSQIPKAAVEPAQPARKPAIALRKDDEPVAGPSCIIKGSRPLLVATPTASKARSSPLPQPRPAPQAPGGAPRIILKTAVAVHTPVTTRQKLLDAIYAQYLALYGNLKGAEALAGRDALAQEDECYKATASGTYRNAVISVIGRMKKRPVALRDDDPDLVTGTMSEWEGKQAEREKLARGHGILTAEKVERYLLQLDQMTALGYITTVPEGLGGTTRLAHGEMHACSRCGTSFVVSEVDLPGDDQECAHHWGRLATERLNGTKQRVHSCCRLPMGSPPCAKGRHVFADSSPEALHTRSAFVDTSSLAASTSSTQVHLPIAAVDCELVYATSGQSLARVTVVAPSATQRSARAMACDTILDEWVSLPAGARVLDLLTRFSGIRQDDLDPTKGKAKLDIEGAKKALAAVGVTDKTILVGHGLENDVKALRIVHARCIDTAALFPHPQGLPFRLSLRALAATHLKKFVQTADPTVGHSSAEDAVTALELVRFKMMSEAGS